MCIRDRYEVTVTGDKYSTFEIPVAINQDMEVILHSTSMDTEIKYIANVTADIPQADEKTPEEAAMAWIQENCIDGNIFSQCSEAYVKVISKDGDTYDLAYRSATNATIKKNVKPVSYTHLDVYKRQTPDTKDDTDVPKTGDNMGLGLMMLLVVGGAGSAAVFYKKRNVA